MAKPTLALGTGPWTKVERTQFEKGIINFGWGKWLKINDLIPTRSKNQIKSHAQKFRKHKVPEYEQLQEARAANVAAAVAVAAKRAMQRNTKAKKAPKTPLRSPARRRTRRRCSAPSNIFLGDAGTASLGKIDPLLLTPAKKTMAKELPFLKPKKMQCPPPPSPAAGDDLAQLTSVASRVTLDIAKKTSSSPPPAVPSPASSLAVSVKCLDLMSPSRTTATKPHYPQEYQDDLAVLAATVTPSPCTHKNLLAEAKKMDITITEEENQKLVMLDNDIEVCDHFAKVDDIIDPSLPLEVDDHDLDMMAGFLDPSWNIFDDGGGPISHGDDPFINALLDEKESLQIPPNVRPDLQLFLNLRSHITSSPDYNNPKEYIVSEDGLSRKGLEKGALCRSRIRDLLGEHLDMGWWRDGTFANASNAAADAGTTRVIQSALGALGEVEGGGNKDGNISFKKFALDRLVALAAVMLDMDHWHTPSVAQRPTSAGTTDISTIMEAQRFNEEDDIRHIGQLLSGLWARVDKSLERDGYTLLGGNDISFRMERDVAINTMMTRLVLISRQEEIITSPHV